MVGVGVSGQVVVVGLLALLTWTGLGLVVVNVNPGELAARLLFLALLYVALISTFGLIAYALSFRLFASKSYRGNLAGSLQHGGLWATGATAAAVLQMARMLNWVGGAVLLALLALAQFVVIARQPGPRPGRRRAREANP